MTAAVSQPAHDLRRMTSQPTITLSAPIQSQSPTATAGSKVPATSSSPLATPKHAGPGPLLPSVSASHAPPARSQSIPSSPTSVHSSSSAIFERDIEPVGFQSSPLKASDPHHTSRAQPHEPVEQSVPSVLTSAVSALSLSTPPPPLSLSASTSSTSTNNTLSTPASPSYSTKRRSIYDNPTSPGAGDGSFNTGDISVIAPASGSSASSKIAANLDYVGSPSRGASLLLSGIATPRSMSRSPSPPATARPVSILSDAAGSGSARSTSPRPIGERERERERENTLQAQQSSPPSSFSGARLPPASNIDAASPGTDSQPISPLPTSPTSPVSPTSTTATSVSPTAGAGPSSLGLAGFVPGTGPIPRSRPPQSATRPLSQTQSQSSLLPEDDFGFTADDTLALNTSGAGTRLSFISYHDLLVSTPLSAAPLSSITSGASQPPPLLPAAASQQGSPSPPELSASAPGSVPGVGVAGQALNVGAPGAGGHATVVGWGKEDGGEWEREGLGKGLEERLEEVLASERAREGGATQPSFRE